jgi:hypothetical protein
MASLLSVGFWDIKIIAETPRLAFLFLKPYGKDSACSRVIHIRVETGEILAQRPQVAQGGPKGKISKPSQHVDHSRQRFIRISFQS